MSINRFFFAMAIIVAAMTIAGCKNSQQQDADGALDFPEEVTSQWYHLTTDEIFPIPKDFIVSDSSIYVVALMGDYWLHEFKKDAPSEAVSTIRNGQGPDELIHGFGMTLSDDCSQRTFFDFNPKQFKTYDLNNNVIRQVDLNRLDVVINNAWPLKDHRGLIASVTAIPQGDGFMPLRTLLLTDLDSMRVIARYDSIDEALTKYRHNLIMSPVYVLSPDEKHLALGTMYGGILEIFSLSDNSIEEYTFKILFPYEMTIKSNTPMEKPLFGFTALCATNELVYGAFLGSKDDRKPTDIGVWKWNGKPVKLIHTDATVLALDIDEKTNTLYAVTFNQETGPQLAKMKL